MFDAQRAEQLRSALLEITATLARIAAQQRADIIDHEDNDIERIDAVLHTVMQTQTQLLKLTRVLSITLLEFLADQETSRDLGLIE